MKCVIFEVNPEDRMRLGIKNKLVYFILHSPFTIFTLSMDLSPSMQESILF